MARHMIVVMYEPLLPIFAEGRVLALPPGAALFRVGAPVREMFQVRSGRVVLQRHTAAGDRLILHGASAGMIPAEASAYATSYHCDAVATAAADVAAIPRARFRAALAADPTLAEAWAAALAHSVQAARLKAEIRSLPRVADRLDAWLEAGNAMPEKGSWQDLAAELSVSREALYRELARRRTA